MPPEPTMHPLLLYGLSTGMGLISVLIGVVWSILRAESKTISDNLEKKASSDTVKELRVANAEAIVGIKDYFHKQLDKQHEDNQARLKELAIKQDREIDWLKEEMGKIADTMKEMRKEANTNQQAMMRQLQEVTILLNRRD